MISVGICINARVSSSRCRRKLVKDFAIDNGLKPGQIVVYGDITNTYDEAKNVKAFGVKNPLEKLLLVTSELHMRRALALFKGQGLSPDAYSVNRDSRRPNWGYFIPSPHGVQRTMDSLYELVGYLGYYLKGAI